MATIQICALITIIITAALLYWTGYRGGRADHHIEDTHNQRNEHAHSIHRLEAPLQAIRAITSALPYIVKSLRTKGLAAENTIRHCWISPKTTDHSRDIQCFSHRPKARTRHTHSS